MTMKIPFEHAVEQHGLADAFADVKGDDLLEARESGALAAPTAWLFGNEARGLRDDLLDLADRALVVPTLGHEDVAFLKKPWT